MRRILFLIAAALTVSLAQAQEVGNVGTSAQLSIIPRIDLNPYIGFNSDAGTDFSLSNSSLYTLFEGSFGEHFSYSIMNHWLSAEPASLYEDTFFHSDTNNWVDWAYITWAPSSFSFTLGKLPLALGVWEQDADDYEAHFDLNSTTWNELQVFHWGGDVSYSFSDDVMATLQLTSSPFTVHPFDNGVFTSSLMFRKDSGDFNILASGNLMGFAKNHFVKMLAFGGLYSFGDFIAGLDTEWHYDKTLMVNEASAVASLEYDPSDKLNLIFKAGYEDCFSVNGFPKLPGAPKSLPLFCSPERFFGGVAAHYFPLADSDALRLHAVVAYDNGFPGLSINVGALYNIAIRIY